MGPRVAAARICHDAIVAKHDSAAISMLQQQVHVEKDLDTTNELRHERLNTKQSQDVAHVLMTMMTAYQRAHPCRLEAEAVQQLAHAS